MSQQHRDGHRASDRKSENRVGLKISHLVREENVPQKQAVAMALSMNRAGRLTAGGGYRRVGARKS